MKQRRAGRTSQRQRDRRRNPFNESTKLIELVEKKHYGDVVNLIEHLKPYLIDEGKALFFLTGIFFDLEKLKGQRQFIIVELALFLKKLKEKKRMDWNAVKMYFSAIFQAPNTAILEFLGNP